MRELREIFMRPGALPIGGRPLRWWVVTGRARGTCHQLGRYLAASPAAAISRARRAKPAELLAGLTLKAEVSR